MTLAARCVTPQDQKIAAFGSSYRGHIGVGEGCDLFEMKKKGLESDLQALKR